MANGHARPRVTHNRFYPVAHVNSITVYIAMVTGRFRILEWTGVEATKGVCQQLVTVTAECAASLMVI